MWSAVTVMKLVIFPSRLNVANQGRGFFLYILSIVGFSLITAASHARYLFAYSLWAVARIVTFGFFFISSTFVFTISWSVVRSSHFSSWHFLIMGCPLCSSACVFFVGENDSKMRKSKYGDNVATAESLAKQSSKNTTHCHATFGMALSMWARACRTCFPQCGSPRQYPRLSLQFLSVPTGCLPECAYP